jgi:hypothetical protein
MLLLSILMFFSPNTQAWDEHHVIMERMLETRASKQRVYPYRKITMPCPDDERKELEIIGKDLHINTARVPIFSTNYCKAGQKNADVMINDMMTSSIIDEPDHGMDQDLPESEDPHHYRRWMGGDTGPTSQGFRHMYFPGFDIWSPLKTFQVPTTPLGEALERIKLLRAEADLYFSRGDKFWGTRLLLWELHYMQDLQQPFHVAQVPSLYFLPLSKIFSGFIGATTHSIANYHYAYEGIALEWAKSAPTSDFKDCFEIPEVDAPNSSFKNPIELISLPVSVDNELGSAVYQLFGDSLKTNEIDLPSGVGAVDYFALSKLREPLVLPDEELRQLSPEEVETYRRRLVQFPALDAVKRITCTLMRNVAQISWDELDRSYIHTHPSNDFVSTKTAR